MKDRAASTRLTFGMLVFPTDTAPSIRPTRIDALTGLRFLAAASIFVWHIREYFMSPNTFSPFYLAGAVPLFFVLSGFVLTVGGMRNSSRTDFFVARIARIWPAHMAALVLLLAIFWPWSKIHFASPESIGNLILNIFLLQDWVPFQEVYWGHNSVAWSISAEMFFYIVFPFFLPQMRKAPACTLAFTTGLVLLWILLLSNIFPTIDTGWLGNMNPVSGLWAFALGIAAGCWHIRNKHRYETTSPAIWTGLEITAICAALGANALLYSLRLSVFPLGLANFVGVMGAAPVYAMLITLLALSRGVCARVLSTKLLVYLGEISFSFYLVHQVIIRWYLDTIFLFDNASQATRLAFIVGASLFASITIFHFIEMPVRGFIVRGWKMLKRGRLKQSALASKKAPPTPISP